MRYVVLALLVPLAACPDRTVAKLEPQPSGQVEKVIPTSTDIDILFVIDDSASTKDKQQVFASNFTNFVAALDAFPGGRPNVHIGVVSTSVDLGATSVDWGSGCPHPSPLDGRLQNTPRVTGCSPPNGHWIEDVAGGPGGTRQTNYTGPLDQTLACIAELGDKGCGFEAPLQAVERALDGTHPENDGFLRPGAFLAVIVLTDEDDASAKDDAIFSLDPTTYRHTDFRAQPMFAYTCDQPIQADGPGTYTNCRTRTDSYLQTPQYYASFLSSLKAPGQVVVAVLGGPPTKDIATGAIPQLNQDLALLKSCDATINGKYAIGRPGIRLNDFVQAFGDHGLYDTICQPDYSNTLDKIGEVLLQSVSPCLEGTVDPTDIDPSPGLQLDCTVSDVTGLGTPASHETVIPRCNMIDDTHPVTSTLPCWWVEHDTISCPSPSSGLVLHVQRAGDPPPGDDIDVKCALD